MQRLRGILTKKIGRLTTRLDDLETSTKQQMEGKKEEFLKSNETDNIKMQLDHHNSLRQRLLQQGAALLPQIQEAENELITRGLDDIGSI